MNAPVTRAELRDELANYTKVDLANALEAWANVIVSTLRGEMHAMEIRLRTELRKELGA